MSRTFNSIINTNLHPSFFESKNVPEPERRTQESIESRSQLFTVGNKSYKDVDLFDETPKKNYAHKALAGIQEVSPFSMLYFSQENILEIQRLIRYNVYVETGKKHVISNQDETEVVIVMRSIYLQYSKVPSNRKDFTKEIIRLNNMVVVQVMPELISNVEQYIGYLKDSNQVAIPIDRGMNPSIKGEKTNRSVSDVLVGDDLFFNSTY